MGYYIETGSSKNKASFLVNNHGGVIISCPNSFDEIPSDKGLITVLDNGAFEAAGFSYNDREFKDFTDSRDTRNRTYVLLDLKLAKELSGYNR